MKARSCQKYSLGDIISKLINKKLNPLTQRRKLFSSQKPSTSSFQDLDLIDYQPSKRKQAINCQKSKSQLEGSSICLADLEIYHDPKRNYSRLFQNSKQQGKEQRRKPLEDPIKEIVTICIHRSQIKFRGIAEIPGKNQCKDGQLIQRNFHDFEGKVEEEQLVLINFFILSHSQKQGQSTPQTGWQEQQEEPIQAPQQSLSNILQMTFYFYQLNILNIFYSATSQMFLRGHELTMSLNDQASHPDLGGRILYFVPTYVLLIVISIFFHRKSVTAQLSFPIYPLPSENPQNFIYYTVVVFMGVIGVYNTFGNYWTAYDWILYAVANILLSVYVFLYQVTSRFTLFLTSIAALLLAVNLQWLFIKTSDMGERNQEIIIRNLIGAVGAWGLIYAVMTIGQFLVHTVGFNKTFQSFGFFIAGFLLLFGIAYWNKTSYCGWIELIGFISVGVLLLVFCGVNTRRNSSLDLQNLLS